MNANADLSNELAFAERGTLMLRARASRNFYAAPAGWRAHCCVERCFTRCRTRRVCRVVGTFGCWQEHVLRCMYGNYLLTRGTVAIRDDSRTSPLSVAFGCAAA